jgi:hypothetical protein
VVHGGGIFLWCNPPVISQVSSGRPPRGATSTRERGDRGPTADASPYGVIRLSSIGKDGWGR